LKNNIKRPSRRSQKKREKRDESKISISCILLVKDICIWAGREMKYVAYQIGNAIKISTLVFPSEDCRSTKIRGELKALRVLGVLRDETWRNWHEDTKRSCKYWEDTWSLFGRH